MSIAIMSQVFKLNIGDAHQKIILLTYADHANEDGTCTWATAKELSQHAGCSTRTVRRHVTCLLENGWLREGNQDAISDGWKKRPPESRPIVYDMTTDEDTRRRWVTEYQPGRRAEAAAHGLDGAVTANMSRANALTRGGADDLSPTPANQTNAQVIVADDLSPTLDPDRPDVSHSLTSGRQGVADAQMSANTSLVPPGGGPFPEPSVPGTTESSQSSEHLRSLNRSRKPSKARASEDQDLFDKAADIAARWWEHRKQGGVVVGNRFVGLRDSIVLAALRSGATVRQVENALVACNETFPSARKFEQALRGDLNSASGRARPAALTVNYPPEEYNGEWQQKPA